MSAAEIRGTELCSLCGYDSRIHDLKHNVACIAVQLQQALKVVEATQEYIRRYHPQVLRSFQTGGSAMISPAYSDLAEVVAKYSEYAFKLKEVKGGKGD